MERKAGEKRKGSHLLDPNTSKKPLIIPPDEAECQDEEQMGTTDAVVPISTAAEEEQAELGGQKMAVGQSMDEVGPEKELCPGLACQPDRLHTLNHLVKCRETCPAVYHAYCLVRVSNINGEFSCGSCGWRKTKEEWHRHIGINNNFYNRHPASPYNLR